MRTVAFVKYVFALVGFGMLAGAFFLYGNTRSFLSGAVRAEGTVVDLVLSRSSDSTTYKPVVRFVTPKGERIEFTSSVSSNPPSYVKGQRVDVLYHTANPYSAKIDDFLSLWGGAVIIGSIGGVFFLIGAGIILAGTLRGRKDEYLRQHGTPIDTEFQSVALNTAVSVNGRHPFRVLTQWQDPSTSELHVFQSDNLWFDPSSYVKGKRIKVLIDRNNPKKYYVDLSFLPKLAK